MVGVISLGVVVGIFIPLVPSCDLGGPSRHDYTAKYAMTKITGTNVSAPIAPQDTADTYPTHHAKYGKGGWRTVATIAERDAIPADRLEPGSVAYVVADSTPYVFEGGIWTDFVATQDHLDSTAVKWALQFISLQAMIAERWAEELKK